VVHHQRIVDEIYDGAACVDEVGERCGAGTRCGGCVGMIEQLVVVHTPSRTLAA
jgi:NAD(P)H-nitrite reductase large subunit